MRWETGSLHSFQVPLSTTVTNCRERRRNLALETLGRHCLHHVASTAGGNPDRDHLPRRTRRQQPRQPGGVSPEPGSEEPPANSDRGASVRSQPGAPTGSRSCTSGPTGCSPPAHAWLATLSQSSATKDVTGTVGETPWDPRAGGCGVWVRGWGQGEHVCSPDTGGHRALQGFRRKGSRVFMAVFL